MSPPQGNGSCQNGFTCRISSWVYLILIRLFPFGIQYGRMTWESAVGHNLAMLTIRIFLSREDFVGWAYSPTVASPPDERPVGEYAHPTLGCGEADPALLASWRSWRLFFIR